MHVAIEASTDTEVIDYLLSPAGDEVLAYFAFASMLPGLSFPEGLEVSFDEIQMGIDASSLLRERLDCIRRSMVSLAQLHDLIAGFEQVVGYRPG